VSPGFSWILLDSPVSSGELAVELGTWLLGAVRSYVEEKTRQMVAVQSVYSDQNDKMCERCSTQDIRLWCKIVRCEELCLYTKQGFMDGSEKGISCLTG